MSQYTFPGSSGSMKGFSPGKPLSSFGGVEPDMSVQGSQAGSPSAGAKLCTELTLMELLVRATFALPCVALCRRELEEREFEFFDFPTRVGRRAGAEPMPTFCACATTSSGGGNPQGASQ